MNGLLGATTAGFVFLLSGEGCGRGRSPRWRRSFRRRKRARGLEFGDDSFGDILSASVEVEVDWLGSGDIDVDVLRFL